MMNSTLLPAAKPLYKQVSLKVIGSLIFPASILVLTPTGLGGQTKDAVLKDSTNLILSEPNSETISGYDALITLDETNISSNKKHGIHGVLYTTNTSSKINSNLMSLDIFTPPDNGGDVSGAYIRQTGGGNAVSVFNLCGERPKGFVAYCNDGFAIEAQVDGSKNSVFSSASEGSALLAVVTGSLGTGLSIYPDKKTLPDARAIHVGTTDNSRENFFVDMSGKVFARNRVQTEGGVMAYNLDPHSPVYQANTGSQSAFFANAQSRDSIAFLVKPTSNDAVGALALSVETVEGRDVAHIDTKGAASFTSLEINGSSLAPQLRSASPPLGGKLLQNGRCDSTNVPVLGVTVSMTVSVSAAGGIDPGDGFFVRGYVSGPDSVTVKVCNQSGGGATPALTSYNVRVDQ